MFEDSDDELPDLRHPRSRISVAAAAGGLGGDKIDAADQEALELQRVKAKYSRATASYRPAPSLLHRRRARSGYLYYVHAVQRFWSEQISVVVDHSGSRDHLALERTFLGYLRTSLALSMIGVTVSQLFSLSHSPHPNAVFGFFVLGKPLAAISQFAAIYALFIGAYRTWRLQRAIVHDKAISGGIELVLLGGGCFAILLMFFVLVIAVDINKEDTL